MAHENESGALIRADRLCKTFDYYKKEQGLKNSLKNLFHRETLTKCCEVAQREMRQFIRDYNRETGATIILTSHYIQDIEALCERVIIISEGEKVFDGALGGIRAQESKLLVFRVRDGAAASGLEAFGAVERRKESEYAVTVKAGLVRDCLARVISEFDVTDIAIEEEPIENYIIKIYNGGGGAGDE